MMRLVPEEIKMDGQHDVNVNINVNVITSKALSFVPKLKP